jgi:hypothetical protein
VGGGAILLSAGGLLFALQGRSIPINGPINLGKDISLSFCTKHPGRAPIETARSSREGTREKISRTIEGFRLGTSKDAVLQELRDGWNEKYFPYQTATSDQLESARRFLEAPSWFSSVDSGILTDLKCGERSRCLGIYFRTDTVDWIQLHFYNDCLYEIDIRSPNDRMFNLLVEKYGKPNTHRNALIAQVYEWQDTWTKLRLQATAGSSRPALSYTDNQLVAEMAAAEQRLQAEERARQERLNRTTPRGY